MKSRKLQNFLIALCVAVAYFGIITPSSIANANAKVSPPSPHLIPAIANGAVLTIHNNGSAGYCLGITGASKNEGVSAIIWACNGNDDQKWKYELMGSNLYGPYFRLRNVHSNQCLGFYQGTTHEGATPIQWACNGNSDQDWLYSAPNFPYNSLVNSNSRYCLGVLNGNIYSGAPPIQWACNDNSDQVWTMLS